MQSKAGADAGASCGVAGRASARESRRAESPAAPARLRRRLVTAYGLGALAASAVLTAFTFVTTRDLEPTALRVFIFGYVFAWPLAPALAALLNDRRFGLVRLTAAYVLLGAAVVLAWSLVALFALAHADVRPLANVQAYLVILANTAALPFGIVVISGARRIGPVVPLALAGLLVFSFGALAIHDAFMRAIDVAPLRAPLARIGYTPLFLIAALPVGFACWQAQH